MFQRYTIFKDTVEQNIIGRLQKIRNISSHMLTENLYSIKEVQVKDAEKKYFNS